MPLPLLFIGFAAATGSLGIGKGVKAGMDASKANKLNRSANEIVEDAVDTINRQRKACDYALSELGEQKLFILNSSIVDFIDAFTKLKNVEFSESVGLDELKDFSTDKKEFEELKEMAKFAGSVAGGAAAGTAGGALVAMGAYGAAQSLALASTGTAISALSGAAASNATLAFFGGGSLATGGLGMAGGAAVLGGLVAGPALMVMGLVAGAAAKKTLEKAKTNHAEAEQISEELGTASVQCEAIRRRSYMFYNLLSRLDSRFLPLIYRMEDIISEEGVDYSLFSNDSKKVVASCASIAVSIKSVLDTPILTESGMLAPESYDVVKAIESKMSLSIE